MALLDRILTIVATATITSLIWIVAGPFLLERVSSVDSAPSGVAKAEERVGVQSLLGQQGRGGGSAGAVAPPVRQGLTARGAALMVPVVGIAPAALSDTWNAPRDGGERQHEAIDIMAPTGTPVVAAAPGVIEKLFLSDAGGKTIYVRSPDKRIVLYYAHLDAYANGLREGQQVREGQALGTVGASGNADPAAPHLHFAVFETSPQASWYEEGTPINPYPLLTGRR